MMAHPMTSPRRGRTFRRGGLLIAAALSAAAFAAPGAAHAAPCPGADVPLNQATIAQRAQASDALICLANDARANAGLPQLTPDQSLSDFARSKSDRVTRNYPNDACGGVADNGFPNSVCVESVEVLVPAPTAQQLFDGILTGNGNAIMNPDVTTIGAGVSNGNPTDGPTGAGMTADVLTIRSPDAGGNTGGGNTGGGNTGGGNGDCAGADAPITQDTIGVAEDAITCLVNKERANAGLAPLAVNATLHGTATAHSTDMVGRQFFAHTNPDNNTFCDRIQAAGWPGAQCQDTDQGPRTACTNCRENIGWRGAGATPNDFMYDPAHGGQDGWMTEPPDANGHRWHREAILGPYNAIGVGLVVGDPEGGDGVTATQDFGG